MIKGTNFSAVHCITRGGKNNYFYYTEQLM